MDETALGLLETQGLIAAIEAADAMVKTAQVRLVSIERTVPALITVHVVGEVAAVQASVDAGRAAAERVGRVVSAHVIPRPDGAVRTLTRLSQEPALPAGSLRVEAAARTDHGPDPLDEMTVRELRAMARDIADFPLQGREIARARKDELIVHLKALR